MADHYGDAERVIGHHHQTHASSPTKQMTAFTKWCPAENGVKTFSNAEAAVDLALSRMGGQKQIALLQYHIWDYTNDTYIHNLTHLTTLQSQGKIAHIGLTNTDAAHLKLLLDTGFPIATNQVSCSVLDRRVITGRLNDLCLAHGVGLLCYGTLLGGFLSEKWLGATEPTDTDALNWSLRKYLRFIHAAGGWAPFQAVLGALDAVARKHSVSIAAVATRWVLDIPSVKAVIVGARLTAQSRAYAERNLLAFSFWFDDEDRSVIAAAQEGLTAIPGDCGDEYRRPPFLTAAGDLSHHVRETDGAREVREAVAQGKRVEYLTGSKWEPICVSFAVHPLCTCLTQISNGPSGDTTSTTTNPSFFQGYSRAVRIGSHIHISGTTANPPSSLPSLTVIGGTSAESQAVWILDIIAGALKALGSSMQDLVRTRVMLPDAKGDCEAVSTAHGWAMQSAGRGVLPANTLVQVGLYEEQFRVEIEAWAEVGYAERGVLRIFKS